MHLHSVHIHARLTITLYFFNDQKILQYKISKFYLVLTVTVKLLNTVLNIPNSKLIVDKPNNPSQSLPHKMGGLKNILCYQFYVIKKSFSIIFPITGRRREDLFVT